MAFELNVKISETSGIQEIVIDGITMQVNEGWKAVEYSSGEGYLGYGADAYDALRDLIDRIEEEEYFRPD